MQIRCATLLAYGSTGRVLNTMKGVKVRQPRRPKVNRSSALTLRCTPDERAEIEARALASGLPLSEFIRVSAQTVTIRARADLDAVAGLAKIAGDLGRLGGLLKLWLAERRGDGAPAVEVDKVLADIKGAIDLLAEKAAAI